MRCFAPAAGVDAMAAKERIVIVDGYNIIGAWPEIAHGRTLEESREALISRLHDYAGYTGQTVIAVFDAWQSGRRGRTDEELGRFRVVYTKKGETADHYIERYCSAHSRAVSLERVELRVATSDGVEQVVALGRGATRLSARELIEEITRTASRMGTGPAIRQGKSTILDMLPEEVRVKLEKMRRGE
jgi:predicted RNA-binding protein with PIN domain